jgi:hypothetical protein
MGEMTNEAAVQNVDLKIWREGPLGRLGLHRRVTLECIIKE